MWRFSATRAGLWLSALLAWKLDPLTLYFHDGDRVTIIPSYVGRPKHPAWYYRVRKHPDVVYGGVPFRAEVVEDEAERRRLWGLADRVFPLFARYREWAAESGRTIPIVQLVPRS